MLAKFLTALWIQLNLKIILKNNENRLVVRKYRNIMTEENILVVMATPSQGYSLTQEDIIFYLKLHKNTVLWPVYWLTSHV